MTEPTNQTANDEVITIRDEKGRERMILPALPPLPDGAKLDVEIHGDFGKLVEAMCAVTWPTITKDARNPHLGNRFADLSGLIEKLKPALAAHGLAVMQFHSATTSGVTVVTILGHTSGGYVRGSLFMPVYLPVKGVSDEQAFGKAATFARRYSYQAALSVAAEDDEDGHAVRDYRDTKRDQPAPTTTRRVDPQQHPADGRGAHANVAPKANGKPYEQRMREATSLAELRKIGTEINADKSVTDDARKKYTAIYVEEKGKLDKASGSSGARVPGAEG